MCSFICFWTLGHPSQRLSHFLHHWDKILDTWNLKIYLGHIFKVSVLVCLLEEYVNMWTVCGEESCSQQDGQEVERRRNQRWACISQFILSDLSLLVETLLQRTSQLHWHHDTVAFPAHILMCMRFWGDLQKWSMTGNVKNSEHAVCLNTYVQFFRLYIRVIMESLC